MRIIVTIAMGFEHHLHRLEHGPVAEVNIITEDRPEVNSHDSNIEEMTIVNPGTGDHVEVLRIAKAQFSRDHDPVMVLAQRV